MDIRVKNFYKRWNILYDEEKQFEEFKNRILISFDTVLGRIFLQDEKLQEEYIKLMGMSVAPISTVHKGGNFMKSMSNVQYAITGYIITFEETRIWKLLTNIDNLTDLIRAIQSVFWLKIDESIKNKFYESIKKDIQLSCIPINVKKTKHGIILYPKGAKLLDEKLVNDVLFWLNSYPNVLKSFQEALQMYSSGKYQRDIADKMRLSLETFLREILGNNNRLEKQISPLGNFLKTKNVPKYIRNMYTQLLSYYCDYQNEYVKHNDKVDKRELEFIIYLTGSFMRFLLTLREAE